jgi:hypothetical protein
LKRAWQAQFLSYTLVTFRKNVFFKDVQMILVSFLEISKMDVTELNCGQAAKKNSKLKRAWQAQFLSYTLVTLRKNVFFKDVQMILVSFFIFSFFLQNAWDSIYSLFISFTAIDF